MQVKFLHICHLLEVYAYIAEHELQPPAVSLRQRLEQALPLRLPEPKNLPDFLDGIVTVLRQIPNFHGESQPLKIGRPFRYLEVFAAFTSRSTLRDCGLNINFISKHISKRHFS